MSSPNPQPLATPFLQADERVEKHRNFDCPNYDDCLNTCVREKWVNFSCLHCALNDVRPEHPDLVRWLTVARVLLSREDFEALETRTARLPDD